VSLTDDLEYLHSPERTPEQVLSFIAAKLSSIEEHQSTDFARLNNQEKAINRMEKRCAERTGTGRCEPAKDKWPLGKIATVAVVVATAIAAAIVAVVKVLA
jgi:hypothetical protein